MSAGKADSGPELKYMCHTVKKLMMQRIFLTEKKEGESSTGRTDELTTVQNLLWSLSSNTYCLLGGASPSHFYIMIL